MSRTLLFGLVFFAGMLFGALVVSQRWPPVPFIARLAVWIFGTPHPAALAGYTERVGQFALSRRKADVAMVGDSITALAEWQDLLPAVKVANRGIAGDTLAGMIMRTDTIQATGARTIVLMAGINDLALGRSTEQVATDYARLCDLLAGEGRRLIVLSTLPVFKSDQRRIPVDRLNASVAELNAELRVLATQRGYDYLDLWPLLASGGALSPDVSIDGQHLTGEGYRRWSSVLATALERR